MKKNFLFIMLLICIQQYIRAQEAPLKNGIALGYGIGQYGKDFGFGLHATTPFFAHEHMAIRLRGNLAFNDHLTPASESTWSPYGNLSLGLVGIGGTISQSIRLYGEGGAFCILPSGEFSSEKMNMGGYGLFGFEFFMTPHFNYYIELGGVGSGAIADRVPGKPIYSNGLLINAGLRVTL